MSSAPILDYSLDDPPAREEVGGRSPKWDAIYQALAVFDRGRWLSITLPSLPDAKRAQRSVRDYWRRTRGEELSIRRELLRGGYVKVRFRRPVTAVRVLRLQLDDPPEVEE